MRPLGRTLAVCLALPATTGQADWTCRLTQVGCDLICPDMQVAFEVDRNQFVNPQNPNDPPRRQVTTVTMDDATFVAQAILMAGGVEGFHEDAGALGSRLMIVRPDGTARLTLRPQNTEWTGQCVKSD
ncbi:hypothetical protein [Pseudooctadecabacter jejudonensis]|uniref:Uncharacterized protein n=1 Tax=Pseudooctadecabacter jejudonensis TaxID=1391910 RepID=A0A1Y5REW8_9RHOB|nr:hypothetical protein [Pseudooctadecabacter jejudonensis]SLN15910.1 hypothetical protein PSJ8397_00377 [Pseudooctadecabacter jejudonensis]